MKKTINTLLVASAIFLSGELLAASTVLNISTGYNNTTSSSILTGTDPEWQLMYNGTGTPITPYVANNSGGLGHVAIYPDPSPHSGLSTQGNHVWRYTFQNPYCLISPEPGDVALYIYFASGDDAIVGFNVNSTFTHNFSTQPSFTAPFNNPLSPMVITMPASALQVGTNYIDFIVYNYNYPDGGQTPHWLDLEASLIYHHNPTQAMVPSFYAPSSICLGSSLLLNGTTSTGNYATNYWEMYECTSTGTIFGPVIWNTAPSLGSPGYANIPAGTFTTCDKYYKIFLHGSNTTAPSPCQTSASTFKMIYIACPPSVNAGADQTICAGSCVTLNASGPKKGHTYNWYLSGDEPTHIGSGSSIVLCPTQTTTYCVTVTNNLSGCTATDCITINVQNPDPYFAATATPVGSYATISATPTVAPLYQFEWIIEELDGGLNTVWTVYGSSMNTCWANTGTETFDGFNGLVSTTTIPPATDPVFCNPNPGKFKQGTYYRITRGVWSHHCPYNSWSVVVGPGRSGEFTIEEDKNAPDPARLEGTYAAKLKKRLAIYPNPTSGSLILNYKLTDGTHGVVKITDITGRILQTVLLLEGSMEQQIDLSNFVDGTYLVNFYNEDALIETQKVIVNK